MKTNEPTRCIDAAFGDEYPGYTLEFWTLAPGTNRSTAKLHRADGPALILTDPDGKTVVEEWRYAGERRRFPGSTEAEPTVIIRWGSKEDIQRLSVMIRNLDLPDELQKAFYSSYGLVQSLRELPVNSRMELWYSGDRLDRGDLPALCIVDAEDYVVYEEWWEFGRREPDKKHYSQKTRWINKVCDRHFSPKTFKGTAGRMSVLFLFGLVRILLKLALLPLRLLATILYYFLTAIEHERQMGAIQADIRREKRNRKRAAKRQCCCCCKCNCR
jgi:hypothetical protein